MTIDLIIISFFVAANLSLGSIVFSRRKSLFANRAFLSITIFLTLWMLSNFFLPKTQHAEGLANVLNGLAYSWGFLAIFASLVFALAYPTENSLVKDRRKLAGLAVTAVGFAIFSALPYVAGTVFFDTRGSVQFHSGRLENLYTLCTLLIVVVIVGRYISVIRASKGPEKAQAVLIMIALAASIFIAVLVNLVLPALDVGIDFAYFSPITSLIVLSFIAYAITRHGLFDVRPFIARSLAYLLSVVTLLAVFSGSAVLVIQIFAKGDLSVYQTLYFAGLSVLLAILYQPTKRYFDKISNRLFYRDSYDAQEVINTINSKLVNTLNLSVLLDNTAALLENEMGISFSEFYLSHESEKGLVSQKKIKRLLSKTEWQGFERHTKGKWRVLALSDNSLHEDMRAKMTELGIEAVVRMSAGGEVVGFLLVGGRKSGNSFTSQDLQLLEIVADEVAIAVQNALRFEVISQFNVTLQQKVDDATRKLRSSNEKLRKLDETKDEFISMASHQLRTPLTSVKGYLSMVLEGDAGKLNEQQEALLKQSFLSSQRMVNLIADLLNLSRLNTGKFVIDPSPTDLRTVVEQEMEQLQEAAKAKHITMSYTRPESFPTLMLDENKIHQVVMNFMDNAIYYTPDGGSITISLVETPTAVEYRVQDTGIGVPRELQRHLFTKFYRADNARRMRPDGTGLGIYMAKKVVVAQQGTIVFESEEGKGSTFGFRFNKTNHLAAPETTPPKVT